jgi:hypothetical protein
VFCLFEGTEIQEDQKEKKEEDGELCEWNGSMIEINSKEGRIEESFFLNNSNGGIRMNGGKMKIMKSEFMNNNPFLDKYPSFRRNIFCFDGKLNVESLKGGDGLKVNSSLFLSFSSKCSLEGIMKERESPCFIPSLIDFEILSSPPSNEIVDKEIIFSGNYLFPCSLSLFLSSFSSDGNIELGNVTSLLSSFNSQCGKPN